MPTAMNEAEKLAGAVFKAAINCGHEIDADQIVLYFNPNKPGNNALNQLHLRIEEVCRHQAAHDNAILERGIQIGMLRQREIAGAPQPEAQPQKLLGYLSEHTGPDGPYKWQFSKTPSGVYRDTALRVIPVYEPSAPSAQAEQKGGA